VREEERVSALAAGAVGVMGLGERTASEKAFRKREDSDRSTSAAEYV
jgi:hypothetical protein